MSEAPQFLGDELVKFGLPFCTQLLTATNEVEVRHLFAQHRVPEAIVEAYFELPEPDRELEVFKVFRRVRDAHLPAQPALRLRGGLSGFWSGYPYGEVDENALLLWINFGRRGTPPTR